MHQPGNLIAQLWTYSRAVSVSDLHQSMFHLEMHCKESNLVWQKFAFLMFQMCSLHWVWQVCWLMRNYQVLCVMSWVYMVMQCWGSQKTVRQILLHY